MGIIRNTKSVQTLLNVFKETENALSVVALVNALQKQMNKTTVYRILQRVEEEGVLHSFTGKDGNKWYAKCKNCSSSYHQDVHPHFQCKDCGKTKCISLEVLIPVLPNHKIDSAELLLLGQCEDCLS